MSTTSATYAGGELTTVQKLRGLPWSIASNAANTFFAQFVFFGSVFTLFLDALGLSKGQIGFLLSLLPFFGLVALFVTPAIDRMGYKRAYLFFFGARKLVTIPLLFTPWVLATFGAETTLLFVSAVVAAFSLLRAIAETARIPWVQEYVPASMQGMYTANNNMWTASCGFVAVLVASFVIGRSPGLSGFIGLFAAGIVFGLLSTWFMAYVPGGRPRPATAPRPKRELWAAARDRNFVIYLAGVGLLTVAATPVNSFQPLFMQEEVGLASGQVILLQIGGLLGSLLTSFAWGWAADRYGSKPVMLLGVLVRAVLPLALILMPRAGDTRLTLALVIAFLFGAADIGWAVGSTRLLYVGVVPPEKRSDYMALYFAWIGIVGGISQLLGGRLLDLSGSLRGTVLGVPIDPFTPLFLGAVAIALLCAAVMRTVRAETDVGVGEFAGMWLRGNPLQAIGSIIRYQFAHDEVSAVEVTERMGRSGSPLTVEELLDTLEDPRFNVRFEAIVSIARMPPEPRLTERLIEILNGTELAMSAMAAWALGRTGDRHAYGPLVAALDSEYQSIRAHSARALGRVHNPSAIPILRKRLAGEHDKGLQMAYASALGNLQARAAAPELLELLYETENPGARLELALSVARLIGDEHYFIQLVRQMRQDAGTTASQALTGARRRLQKTRIADGAAQATLERSALAFSYDDLAEGSAQLAAALEQMKLGWFADPGDRVLVEAAARLRQHGAARREYLVLALHVLHSCGYTSSVRY